MGSCWFRCEPVFRDSGHLHLNWFCDLFNFVPMSPPIGLRQMFIREMNCSYMKNRLYKLHGKLLSLSSMKFQALSSKSMVFIAKPCWTFVSKQKLDKIMLFVQWKFCSKSLKLWFELPMSPPIGLRQMFIREMNCSYMKNRLYKLHGKLLSLSSMKFQALSSKSMVFIAKPCWTFVSKQKLDKIMLFVQWKFCSKSLKLWFELPHNNSRKVHENKRLHWHISL